MSEKASRTSSGNVKKENKHGTPYDESEIKYIRKNYAVMPVGEMAKVLGRTESALSTKMYLMGLSKIKKEKRPSHKWTDAEIAYLKTAHKSKTDEQMAKKVGVGRITVQRQRVKLGLPGHKNTNDCERKGYMQTRVDGKRVWKHRYVVSKSIGRALTKKERVHHIDLDKLNNELENLYLCKDEREHATLHWNLNSVASNLVKKKLIIFNKGIGEYGLSVLLEELAKRVDG